MLTVIGGAALDETILVPTLPQAGDEFTVLVDALQPGGKASNTAARSAALGVRTQLITRYGDDGPAQILRDHYRQLAKLSVIEAGLATRTAVATVMVTPDAERTILFRLPPGGNDPEPTPMALAAAKRSDVVWVDIMDPAKRAVFHAATAGATRGLPVQKLGDAVAAGQQWELLVGSLADIDQPPSYELLQEAGAWLCVLTDGGKGGVFWAAGAPELGWSSFDPAGCKDVMDTTGAGDAFLGGLLAGLDRRLPVSTCLHTAAWSGARAVEERGAWPSLSAFAQARHSSVSLWRKAGQKPHL